jgi:hypothetical protein
MNYEIVKYHPEFRSQVVELQKHLWGPDVALNAAYLEWKHEHNPYVETPLIYLALCGGQVVGMRGMYGAKWQIGYPCQTFLGLCASDSVIAPDHRTRGLYRKLTMAALNDLTNSGNTYVFSLSANKITYLGCLAMGWCGIGTLQVMQRRSADGLSSLSSTEEPHPFYSLDRKGAGSGGEASPHVSVELTARPKAMAELIERIGGDGRMRHVRDQQYFAWRFQNPRAVYRFLFWRDARLEGYLVLRRWVYTERVGVSIVDWEATNAQARADLLQAAIHWGNFGSLTIWSATLPDEAKTLLQIADFKELEGTGNTTRYVPTVLVRPIRDEMLKGDWVLADRRLLDLANWDLRMIYSDGN